MKEKKNIEDSSSSSGEKPFRLLCRKLVGFGYALLSAISGAAGLLLVKFVDDATPEEMQFARSLVQYLTMLPILQYKKQDYLHSSGWINFFVFASSLTAVTANWATNYSVMFIPLGDAVSIMYTYVTFTGIAACIFLKEACSAVDALLSVFTVGGLVLVARPTYIFGGQSDDSSPNHVAGILLALTSALLSTFTYTFLRKVGPKAHYSLSQFHYSWIGVSLSLGLGALRYPLRIPCLYDVIIVTSSATLALLSHLFMTVGLQREKAGPLVVVQSTQIIFAIVLQFIFLGYRPPLTSLVGSLIIFGCSVGLTVKKFRHDGD